MPQASGNRLSFIVTLTLALGCAAPPRSEVEIPRPEGPRPDQPDQAEDYFLLERLPPGQTAELDLWAYYEAAGRHRDALPRYSSRTGAELPSALEMEKHPEPAAKAAELATWEQLGPGNIGGRTRALVIDPDRPDILYAAGVTGGVWKSLNGGRSWRALDDLMPSITVSSLAMDPGDSRVLYAGTGEGVFRSASSFRGAGIFRSTDSGKSWKRLDATWNQDFRHVNDLVISHGDPRRIYAATRTGVWRSRNRGSTWARILDPQVLGGCFDLAIRTDQPSGDVLLASCGNLATATVFRTSQAEGGATWTPVLSEADMGRTSLAVAPSNQDVVYALAASLGETPETEAYVHGLHAVFRSDRGGDAGSWTAVLRNDDPVALNTFLLSRPAFAAGVECFGFDENDFSGQGWYDNVIAVDPVDPEVVYVGGIDLFRSDDGGRNWGIMSYWWFSPPSAHADHHALVFHPDYDGGSNRTLFVGNDGGVWKTQNARRFTATGPDAPCNPGNTGVQWASLNNGYAVTQFYHGVPFPDGLTYFGGTQDNGTVLGTDGGRLNGWQSILGGDGGYTAIDPRNPRILYAETQGLGLRKSVDGGRRFQLAISGIDDDSDDFLFIVPYVMDPRRSQRLWLGGRSVWRTTNGAARWHRASSPLSGTALVSALAVSPTDPNRVLVGSSGGQVHRNDRALTADATTNWPYTTLRTGFISWLAFDPSDDDVVYATSSTVGGQHVFKSSDGGANWEVIDGAGPRRLPNLPAHTIVVDPADPSRLYVGTDRGVFVSTTGGRQWAVENTGFANVIVQALSLVERDGRRFLFAFTHGRGAWRVEIGASQ